jgi:hypothetical protein
MMGSQLVETKVNRLFINPLQNAKALWRSHLSSDLLRANVCDLSHVYRIYNSILMKEKTATAII